MAPKTDNNSWQWFFTLMFGAVLAMQGYNIDQQNKADERQNLYIERLIKIENKQDRNDEKCKSFEIRFDKIEAILNKNEEDENYPSQIKR